MRSYQEIARRIAKIILSPESAIGFIDGVLSVPKDIGYLAFGFIDTDSRYQRESEKIRMLTAIKYGLLENHNFIKTIETVLDIFNNTVPEDKQNAIYGKTMASVAGRTITNSLIAGKLATIIAQRSSFLITLRGGLIGNTLLIGGMVERCIYTSERLQQYNPEIYNRLRTRDLDLLYFLVEPALNPFVDALKIRNTQGQVAFERLLSMVENEINAK
ncbi:MULTISPECIES: hypothetical protein [Pantoea]|uniref:hypothetical protein n=1 Tax=Pantoea TaxID=53335 RepID=UPI001231B236|nr:MULTISPECIES: hypothetical protein [Pantoea]KAA6097108.1 hypothetical protein F3I21_17730 [Pantoea sp. B_9]KAA6110466.1 hypothetical protein F3I18_17940 [Pantoea sp. B_10]WEA06304.1 hypothetical protein PWF83_02470 [Pantoea dispersa]